MNRRDLLAGLAAAAAAPARVDAAAPDIETVYIPPAHRVEDLALLHDTMDEFPFVELVTTAPTLRITHIPVWLDRKQGEYGTIFGHIARNNPQIKAIESHASATIVFHGPHAYISPSWYGNQRAVPTWNFSTVHASGKLAPVEEEAAFYDLLSTLIKRSEGKYGPGEYNFAALPKTYTDSMMKNILGFRLKVETLEGKFKLGQERSEADRTSVLKHLKPEMSAYTAKFYERSTRRP